MARKRGLGYKVCHLDILYCRVIFSSLAVRTAFAKPAIVIDLDYVQSRTHLCQRLPLPQNLFWTHGRRRWQSRAEGMRAGYLNTWRGENRAERVTQIQAWVRGSSSLLPDKLSEDIAYRTESSTNFSFNWILNLDQRLDSLEHYELSPVRLPPALIALLTKPHIGLQAVYSP